MAIITNEIRKTRMHLYYVGEALLVKEQKLKHSQMNFLKFSDLIEKI